MTFKRILLKNQAGVPVASARIGGCPPRVTLPEGVSALLYYTKGTMLPAGDPPFIEGSADLSVLAEKEGGLLFGSTLSQSGAAYAKWRLLQAWEERGKGAPTAPLEAPTQSLEEDTEDASAQIVEVSPKDESLPLTEELPPISEEAGAIEDEPARLERLLERGEPFHLFDSVMPGSRWAIIKEDAAEYLVGVTEDESGKHVLFGVPGAQGFPPDEDGLWSFFPTDDNEEIGWFLTEESGDGTTPQ